MEKITRALHNIDKALDRKRARSPISPGTRLSERDLEEVQQCLTDYQSHLVHEQGEKIQKTGSVPRPPGTPLDEPEPRRLVDAIGQIQYFADRPEVLQDSSPEDVSRFFRALVSGLQKITVTQEKRGRQLHRRWGRAVDVREVSQEIIEASNRVDEVQLVDPEELSKLLGHWGTTLFPYIDDGAVLPWAETALVTRSEKPATPWRVAHAVRQRAAAAKTLPGRAPRLIAELSDDLTEWVDKYEGSDLAPLDREYKQKLRTTDSARRLYEKYINSLQSRSVSPHPHFDKKYQAYRPHTPSPPPRSPEPTPERRASKGDLARQSLPQLRTRSPGFAVTKPTLQGVATTYPAQPKDGQEELSLDVKRGRSQKGSRSVSPTRPSQVLSPSPSPGPSGGETVEIEPTPLRHSPPSREASRSPKAYRVDETSAVRPGGAAGQVLPGGRVELAIDTSQPTTHEVLQGTAEFLAQGPLGSQVHKKGVTISGNVSAADLAAITAGLSDSDEYEAENPDDDDIVD